MYCRYCAYLYGERKANGGWEEIRNRSPIGSSGKCRNRIPLTEEEIKAADLVLFCVDIGVTGKERFKGKPIVEVPTKLGIKSPENLLTKIREKWEAH